MYVYEGFYNSFQEAKKSDLGFESEQWLESQKSLIRDIEKSSWSSLLPLDQNLATVLAGMNHEAPLRVLDIGGGIGATYIWLKKVLSDQIALDYQVVELEAAIKLADQLGLSSTYPELKFSSEMPAQESDLVYFGSSLQYFESWREIIKNAISPETCYVVLSRIPVCEKGSFITLQNYYSSRIPVNVPGAQDLEAFFKASGFMQVLKNASCTPILGQYQPIPTNDIPSQYAIGFCSDLVFHRQK